MAKRGLLERVEERLEKIIEEPFLGAAPFDVKELKRRLVSAIAETGAPYVPDHWYVRFPVGLRERDEEVRAWVSALWRSLLLSVDAEAWAAGASPQIEVAYDPSLARGQMLVGYEFSVAPEPAAGRLHAYTIQGSRGEKAGGRNGRAGPGARPGRRGGLRAQLAKWLLVMALAGAVALLAARPSLGEALRVNLPSPPRVEVPTFSLTPTTYITRIDLYVRSEPSTKGEMVGVIPHGERLRFGPHNVVRGEVVNGEERWVEITPLIGYLTGERRYIWLGGLAKVDEGG